jgi:hypothetical protein
MKLVSDIKGRTYIEGVSEQDAEENIWIKRDKKIGAWRKLSNEKLYY